MKGKYKRRREKAQLARPQVWYLAPGVKVCVTDNVMVSADGSPRMLAPGEVLDSPPPVREFTRSEVLKAERRGTFLGLLAVVVVVTALVIGVS